MPLKRPLRDIIETSSTMIWRAPCSSPFPSTSTERASNPILAVYRDWHVFEKVCRRWLRHDGWEYLRATALEAGRY